MAINLLNENNEIRCKNCNSNMFREEVIFTLKYDDCKAYVKDTVVKSYVCNVCNENIYKTIEQAR